MGVLKVFTAFAGYDSQCMALDRAEINYELVGWSEIDKYAIQAHNAVYPQYKGCNFGDITQIDWSQVPDFDLFTYSFPCTDISQAGLQAGLEENAKTRSSLLWECRKAIEAKKPKYLVMENVKNLAGKKYKPFLDKWCQYLASLGYTNSYAILDASHFNTPQARERVFCVSILNGNEFVFPEGNSTKLRLRDILEETPEQKYFFDSNKMRGIIKNCTFNFANKGKSGIQQVANIVYNTKTKYSNPNRGRTYSIDGLAPTLDTCSGGGRVPKIVVSTKNALYPGVFNESSKWTNVSDDIIIKPDGTSNTIRYLTPRECFRLMGMTENDIDKIQSTKISKTQQHKMAGNSIVINVLSEIFNELFKNSPYSKKPLSLF